MNTRWFYAFEGIDKCGKSTQAANFTAILEQRHRDVVLTAEPWEEVESGRAIRGILRGERRCSPLELQRLFVENRREHITTCIEPALDRGAIVVTDRFALSSIAYGMLTAKEAVLRRMHTDIIGDAMLWPELTILIDVSVETALGRMGVEETLQRFERREMLEGVAGHYAALVAHDPAVLIVNGEAEPDAVFRELLDAFDRRISMF